MLFDSALRRELSRRFWASWVVIFTIVMTIMLIRTLSLASRGQLDPEEITLAMGYAALGRIATILAVALLVSVVMVLGRMQRESELVVWLANGMGPGHFVRPVLRFATPIVVVILALQWWVWPWSNAQLDQLRNRFEQRGDLQRIEPGRFQSSADGRRVFFIDQSSNTDNVASNVFIASQQGQREAVVSAASGRIERDDQGSSLILDAGQRIERGPDGSKVLAFDHYHARVTQETAATSSVGIKSTPSLQLWQNPSPYRMAELTWRLGLAAAAFNFALLALALTRVNPRGSGNGLLLALLVAVIYINLLSIGQGWVATQRMGPWALFGVLHGGLAGLALLAVAWRSRWRMRMRPLAAA
jgi:lipopolysaccharide export system permease protein